MINRKEQVRLFYFFLPQKRDRIAPAKSGILAFSIVRLRSLLTTNKFRRNHYDGRKLVAYTSFAFVYKEIYNSKFERDSMKKNVTPFAEYSVFIFQTTQ